MKAMDSNQEIIKCIIAALEAKDRCLFEHSLHTAFIAQEIARILLTEGLKHSLPEREEIMHAAIVHDIGKLNIPDMILQKSGSLTERELETIKFHPLWGAQFLMKIPSMGQFSVYTHQHHETPDGCGYPCRLKVDDIHPVARLINICDRFSAMTMDRPYRKAIDSDYAVSMIEKDIELFFGGKNKKSITQSLLSIHKSEHVFYDELQGWHTERQILRFPGGK